MGLKAAPVSDDAPAWPSRKAALQKKTLQPKPGIVIKTVQAWRGVDSIDKVFINCVSHMAVEEPMYMQNVVDDDYLDTKGFESLRIPLLVGKPRAWEDESGVQSTCVDVMFNPCVTDRCWKAEGAPGLDAEYYRLALGNLARKFVEQDAGLTLSKTRWTVFKRAKYKGGDSDTNEPLRFELPEECWMDEQPPGPPPTAGGAPPPGSGGPLVEPVEEAAEATTAKKAAKKKKEADVGAGINKKKMNAGFFDKKKDNAVLYPDGSNEGYDPENPGQLRDGTGDPMGWMPKKLRSMVQVADTSTMPEEQQKKMMENYVDTGKRMPGDNAPSQAEAERRMKEVEKQATADRKKKEREKEKLRKQQEKEAADLAKAASEKAVVDNARGAAEAVATTAAAAFKERDYGEAVMKWGEALGCLRAARAPDSDPDVRDCRVSWHNNRAAALLQLGQHPEAEAAATEVLALDGSNLKALFRRGTARASQFKWLGAVRDLEKVVEISPKNTKAAAQLAQAQEQLEKQRQAEEDAEAQKAAEAAAATRAAKEEKRKAAEAKMAEAAAAAAEAAAGGGKDSATSAESARKAAEDAYWADKMEQMAAATASETQKKQQAKMTKSRKGEAGGKQQPEHELTKTADGFKLVITLPGVKSMKGVDIDVSEDEFKLESDEYKLRLYLPQSVDVEAVGAKFSKKKNSLTVQLTRLVSTLGIDATDMNRTAAGAKGQQDDQDSFDRAAYAAPEARFGDAETDAMMSEMARVLSDGSGSGGGGGAMDMGAGMAALMKETMAEHKKQQQTAAAH